MRAHLGAERRLPWRGCDNSSVTLPATTGPRGATGRPPLIAAPPRNVGLRPQHGTTGLRGREAAWLGRVFAGLTGVVPLGPSETFSKRWPGRRLYERLHNGIARNVHAIVAKAEDTSRISPQSPE